MDGIPRSVVESPTRPQAPPPQDPRDPIWLGSIEDEYPETEASIRAAIDDANTERKVLGLPPVSEPTTHQHRMHADLEVIHRMMDLWGTKQVLLWTKSAAAMRGYKGE